MPALALRLVLRLLSNVKPEPGGATALVTASFHLQTGYW
jgi:hypothetical protein